MKTDLKPVLIAAAATIIAAIIAGIFGYVNSRKPEPAPVAPALIAPPATAPAPAAQSVQGNGGDVTIINGDNNIHAGENITIQGEQR
jgi:hypothetical protein